MSDKRIITLSLNLQCEETERKELEGLPVFVGYLRNDLLCVLDNSGSVTVLS